MLTARCLLEGTRLLGVHLYFMLLDYWKPIGFYGETKLCYFSYRPLIYDIMSFLDKLFFVLD